MSLIHQTSCQPHSIRSEQQEREDLLNQRHTRTQTARISRSDLHLDQIGSPRCSCLDQAHWRSPSPPLSLEAYHARDSPGPDLPTTTKSPPSSPTGLLSILNQEAHTVWTPSNTGATWNAKFLDCKIAWCTAISDLLSLCSCYPNSNTIGT